MLSSIVERGVNRSGPRNRRSPYRRLRTTPRSIFPPCSSGADCPGTSHGSRGSRIPRGCNTLRHLRWRRFAVDQCVHVGAAPHLSAGLKALGTDVAVRSVFVKHRVARAVAHEFDDFPPSQKRSKFPWHSPWVPSVSHSGSGVGNTRPFRSLRMHRVGSSHRSRSCIRSTVPE